MVILQLVPLSKPVAITEMVILLILAAFIGWLLAKLILRARIKSLRESIEERKMELAECRAFIPDVSVQAGPLVGNASRTVYPNVAPVASNPDDLRVIEGIGPKIQELLNKEGIYTFTTLSETSPIRISSILRNAGPRFQIHDPTTWPQQAELARFGKWDELEELKKKLISGKAE